MLINIRTIMILNQQTKNCLVLSPKPSSFHVSARKANVSECIANVLEMMDTVDLTVNVRIAKITSKMKNLE